MMHLQVTIMCIIYQKQYEPYFRSFFFFSRDTVSECVFGYIHIEPVSCENVFCLELLELNLNCVRHFISGLSGK